MATISNNYIVLTYEDVEIPAGGGCIAVTITLANPNNPAYNINSILLNGEEQSVPYSGSVCYEANTTELVRYNMLSVGLPNGVALNDWKNIAVQLRQLGVEVDKSGSVSIDDIRVDASGGEYSMPITAKNIQSGTYSVVVDDWVDAEVSATKIVLYISPNDAQTGRTATITIRAIDLAGNTVGDSAVITQVGVDVVPDPENSEPTITVDPDTITATPRNGSYTFALTGDNVDWDTLTFESLINSGDMVFYPIINEDGTGCGVTVTYSGGDDSNLTCGALFRATVTGDETTTGQTVSAVVSVSWVQGGVYPIWEDTECVISNDIEDAPIEFDIYRQESDGSRALVFTGLATAEDNVVSVDIARICEGLMRRDVDNITAISNIYTTFDIDVDGETLATYTFIRDWSYNAGIDYNSGEVYCLNATPCGDLESGSITFYSETGGIVDYVADGNSGTLSVGSGVTTISTAWLANKRLEIAGNIYEAGSGCNRVIFAYRGIYGAWETFGFDRGALHTTQDVSTEIYTREVKGGTTSNWWVVRASTQTGRTYSIETPLLTDEQINRVAHLLSSPEVLFWSAETGTVAVDMSAGSKELVRRRLSGGGSAHVTIDFTIANTLKRI